MSLESFSKMTSVRPVRGAHIGRYELLRPIARGGMGDVWAARLTHASGFEKRFVVKTLLPHLAQHARFREMLLAEASVVAGITHPNVVQAFDAGEDDGLVYVVMEWIEGESLHGLAQATARRGEHFPCGVLLKILSDACRGLHAVHEHRDRAGRPLEIVHRDISPHNLMVALAGVTKVIDFGIAQSGASALGSVSGKVRFMSPEQARGQHVDRSTDVWAIGAVLHRMVTGGSLYEVDTDREFLRLLRAGAPIGPLPAGLPRPIVEIITGALHRDPARRYGSAEALAEALDRAGRSMGLDCDARAVGSFVAAQVDAGCDNATGSVDRDRSRVRRASRTDIDLDEGQEAMTRVQRAM